MEDAPVPTAADQPTVKVSQAVSVDDGEIAHRAYDLFLARGCEHGHDVEDWLQAEHELNESPRSTVPA
jgi:hypothetical protein